MNKEEPFECAVSVHGRVVGGSLLWPVVGIAAVVAVVIPLLAIAMPDRAEALLPFASVPMLAAYGWYFLLHARMRPGMLRLSGNELELRVGKAQWTGSVTRTELLPWRLAGLGTVHGAVLVIDATDAAGKVQTFALAAPEIAAPSPSSQAAFASAIEQVQPRMFAETRALRSLLDYLQAQRSVTASVATASADNVFMLVRRPGAADTLRTMTPWLVTMGAVSVVGVLLGDVMARHPLGPAMVGGVLLAVIAVGIWRTFRRASQPKPQFVLTLHRHELQLCHENGEVVWRTPRPHASPTRETYVYRTKYGSYRFPVLGINGDGGERLSIAVWDPRYARASDPVGSAPDYLVGVPDWQRLCDVMSRESTP